MPSLSLHQLTSSVLLAAIFTVLLLTSLCPEPCAAQFFFKSKSFVPNMGKRALARGAGGIVVSPAGIAPAAAAAAAAAAAQQQQESVIDGAELFALADLNGNGAITPGEFAAFIVHNIPPALLLDTVFALADQDGNGRLDKREFEQFLAQLINRKDKK